MKRNYITTALLALGLITGCVNIQVGTDSKPKHHHEGAESEDGEDKDDDRGKKHEGKKHEGKESEDDEKEEGKHAEGKSHKSREAEEDDEKEEGKGAKDKSEAKLKAQAKISESAARAIAMKKAPNGTIKEGELEMENGKLQWSFDIATPGSKDITEVNINAITGEVISVAKESPSQQAKEKEDEEKERTEKN